ncbi:MAG: PAS domain S-box protein [Verrucomicrobia bacterium]|nr:PAS domain S-box protein [Verrucomicrobiota bacterium]
MTGPLILVVEEEPWVAAEICGKLQDLGCEVIGCAHSRKEALEKIEKRRPDILFLGIEFADPIRRRALTGAIHGKWRLPVILVVEEPDMSGSAVGGEVGDIGCVRWPLDAREVRKCIARVLRKHAEGRQIGEPSEWFREALTSISDAVISTDYAGLIVFINASAEALTGWVARDAHGKPIEEVFSIIDEDKGRPLNRIVRRVMRGKCAIALTSPLVLKARNGLKVPVEGSVAPIIRPGCKAAGVVAVFHDATEKRKAHETLQESEEKFRRVAESATDAILTADAAGRITFWNSGAERVFGYRADEIVGQPLWKLAPERFRAQHMDAYSRALIAGKLKSNQYPRETVGLRKDGNEIAIELSMSVWQLSGAFYCTAIVRDISDRKRSELALLESRIALQKSHDELELRVEQRTSELRKAVWRLEQEVASRAMLEAELRMSEGRYRTLFAAAPAGIAVTNVEGEILDANAALCEMLGIELAGVREMNICSFYANVADRRRLLKRVRREGIVEDFETRLQRRNGTEFSASLRLSSIRMGQQELLLTIVTDITHKQAAERHIQGIAELHELFLSRKSRSEYLQAVARFLRDWSGCACAGIRLLDGKGCMPFVASVGYGLKFLREENQMNLETDACQCLKAVAGRPIDGEVPLVRTTGCFLRHKLADLIAHGMPDGRDPNSLPCVRERYDSLVQAPIYYRGRLVGTIQMADRRNRQFAVETMHFLESVAPLVGEVLHRFEVEEELRKSEARFRSMFNRHKAIMLLIDPESGAIVEANQAAAQFYGYKRNQLCAMNIRDLLDQEADSDGFRSDHGRGVTPPSFSVVHKVAGGSARVVEVHSTPISVGERTLNFAVIHDITERRQLERQVLDASDQERQRIGRDLHDSLGGSLGGLAMVAMALAQTLSEAPPEHSAMAREIVDGINDTLRQARSIARGLCPVGLSACGFVAGLQDLARNVQQRHAIPCLVRVSGEIVVNDDSVASHLFQIIGESVNNAIRHSGAKKIEIRVRQRGQQIAVEVQDDGIGLPKNVEHSSGMGLRIMRYRADILGARLVFRSPRKGGTVVSCLLRVSPRESKV